jgi:hypothetical protein
MFCAVEGDGYGAKSQKDNLILCSRKSRNEPFTAYRYLTFEGLPSMFCWGPRYVAATNELFLTRLSPDLCWSVWVIKNFKPPELTNTSSAMTNEWTPLFDGRDLSEWTPIRLMGTRQERQPRSGRDWIVRDGQLICNADQSGLLRSERQYADFVLELEFKLPSQADSGVAFRFSDEGIPGIHTGMEIQFLGAQFAREHNFEETRQTGAICHAVPPKVNAQALLRGPDQWNTMQINCEGTRIKARMNGTLVVEADTKRVEKLRGQPCSGFIGLYNIGGLARGTAFRNIRIRERNTR